jgi:hypothetical protein
MVRKVDVVIENHAFGTAPVADEDAEHTRAEAHAETAILNVGTMDRVLSERDLFPMMEPQARYLLVAKELGRLFYGSRDESFETALLVRWLRMGSSPICREVRAFAARTARPSEPKEGDG